MNQKLQDILNIIQQSEKLDAEQKENLLKAVKDADKEFEITAFKLERTEKVKKTTAILLEETIEELEQKRKAVEAQNRELEIEASLEKVRAVAMGMNEIEDSLNICNALFNELKKLGFDNIRNTLISIFYDDEKYFLDYDYSDFLGGTVSKIFYNSHPVIEDFMTQIKKASDAFAEIKINREQINSWEAFRKNLGEKPDPRLKNINSFYYYIYSIGTGSIGISNFEQINSEQRKILKRFRNVFDLAFRRYKDIELAESQAREAQIEAALEKVRSRTMGMQKSEELQEVIKLVYEQFAHLKINVDHAGFVVDYTPKGDWHFWIADERDIPSKITHPYFESVWANQFNDAKEKGIDFFATNLNFEEKNKFYNELLSYVPELPQVSKDFYLSCPGLAATTVLFDDVSLYIENFTGTPYTDEENKILMRFGKVFQQTYTRFLDLQKAELQAREAQIEASLEKVRAVAMSMNKSEDLLSICEVSFKEFMKLGFNNIRNALIHVQYDEQKYFMDYDYSDLTGGAITKIEYGSHPVVEEYLQQIRSAKDAFYQGVIKEDQLEEWKNFRRNSGQIDDPRLEEATALYYYFFSIGIGDIGISTLQPIDESQIKILKRFRNVFDLAYRRYDDIKLAEEQARETQIQLALERVRAKAMAMHKSEDLAESVFVVFEELEGLDLGMLRCGIGIMNKQTKSGRVWTTVKTAEGGTAQVSGDESMEIHPMLNYAFEAWKNGMDFDYTLEGDNLISYYKALGATNFKLPEFQKVKSSEKEYKQYYFQTPVKQVGGLFAFRESPFPDEAKQIMKRFADVINLTYTRFYDLQKAEAQARESQIQLALERVRARTMAMHKSEELSETSFVLFEQLKELGEIAEQISILIYNENEKIIELYATIYGNQWNETARLPLEESSVHKKIFKVWQERKKSLVVDLSGKDLDEFNNFKLKYSNQYKSESELPKKRWVVHNAFFSKGVLTFSTHEPRPVETIHLLERFAGVFDLTYTRFLDLQKAEAQAREAEIEAALERVRSRTMAMQKSDELAETASHLFEQLNSLGIKPYRFNIAIVNQTSEECQLWSTSNEGKVIPLGPLIPLKEHTVFNQMYDGWKQQVSVSVLTVKGEDRIEWTKYIMKYVSFNEYKPENIDLERLRNEPAIFSNFFFRQGFIVVHTLEEINDADINIIQRFVNVFEQTYTRFLDLQKAEAQAREAQIEASLERVRSKAMSMHSSEDLALTIDHFFHELKNLNIKPIRCGVGIKDGNLRTVDVTVTSASEKGEDIKLTGKLTLGGHPILDKVYEALQLQAEYFPVLRGEEISEYYQAMNPDIEFPNFSEDDVQYGYYFHYEEGGVFAWTKKELLEEEINIFRKFKSVLSLTYRRYIDLKEAEARSVEAVRQASLDRIRAEIASMRTSEDLNHITPIIWRELKNLEVPFFRCGVYIVDESSEMVQVYLTTPDGKSLGVLNLSFNSNEITGNTVEHWRKKIVYKTHWDKEEFISWTESMMKLGQIKNAETYQGSTTPPESLYLHFVPFAQGMLYVGDVQPLTDEKLQLVKTLAEAFSIAYARYEDFKNLEEAKNKIEITLNELKAAQAQLIHSEKMASLGELTAGIAHEIKNPLNFVNNFSEVSRELLDEMKTEIENKNIDEVIELMEDLKQNLDKINQHGKRADSIVKGMLLHSRGTSGEKTLTDINDLLDQYVNLAYHGMRATNKEFNITIEKDYDESIEKINVVPQDISRVFLNIINNACYAAFDKKKKSENNFSPILKVSTKKVNNKIEVKIGDNGNGIPADHLEKIFQPFFTTKPSGEGTGLGLSLSYDIVTKVHGGEMKVETKVGEGTEFLILLPSN